MAITLDIDPFDDTAKHLYSNNPIICRFTSDEAGADNLRLVVQPSIDGEALPVLVADCNGTGNADFNLSEIVRKYFQKIGRDEFPIAELNTTMILGLSSGALTVQVTEYFGNPLDEGAVDSFLSGYVLWGGVQWERYLTLKWIEQIQPDQKSFLTWQPTTKKVYTEFPQYLAFLQPANTLHAWHVKSKIYYNGGSATWTAYTYSVVNDRQLHLIPVGFDALDIASHLPSGKTLASWEVWVENASNAAVTEHRMYNVNSRYARNKRCFVFRNSLGGFDTLVATGEREEKSELSRTQVKKFLPLQYDVIPGQSYSTEISEQRSFKISSGFRTREEADAYRDIFVSPKVCELVNINYWDSGSSTIKTKQAFVPIEIISNSIPTHADNQFQHFISFEYRYAFTNSSYTP